MATTAQSAANKANAQQSTGPISPEGKATSARNRPTHGFRSAAVLLPGDDPAEYESLLTELSEHFAPTNLTETRLVREMVDAEWRLRRVRCHTESAVSRHTATLAAPEPGHHLAGCSCSTCLGYETKFERQYDRAYSAWTRYPNEQRHNSKLANAGKRALAAPPPAAGETESAELGSNVQNAQPQHVPAETAAPETAHNAPPLLNSPVLKAAA